jgi:hypothetical protein
MSVLSHTYGSDTDRRVSERFFLLFSSFLSVHRQNRSTHTYTHTPSRNEGLVHHHLSSSSPSSFTICTDGCLSISINHRRVHSIEENATLFSSLSSNGYLLFTLIEGGGQQQRVVVIATHK